MRDQRLSHYMDCGICHQSKHMHQYILIIWPTRTLHSWTILTFAVCKICKVFGKSITHHQLWIESATLGILIPVISNWSLGKSTSAWSHKLVWWCARLMYSFIQHRVGGSFSCCLGPFWNIRYRLSLIEVSSVLGEYILHRNCSALLIEEENKTPCPSPLSSVTCCLNTFHALFYHDHSSDLQYRIL